MSWSWSWWWGCVSPWFWSVALDPTLFHEYIDPHSPLDLSRAFSFQNFCKNFPENNFSFAFREIFHFKAEYQKTNIKRRGSEIKFILSCHQYHFVFLEGSHDISYIYIEKHSTEATKIQMPDNILGKSLWHLRRTWYKDEYHLTYSTVGW